MHSTIKAQVLEGPHRMTLQEVELPELKVSDVLIRVRICGIGETDHRVFAGDCELAPPMIPGHQVLGTIEAMGAEVRNLEVGDRVALDSGFQLGVRTFEKQPDASLDEIGMLPPHLGMAGGFADFMIAPAERCFRVPEAIDDYTAALAGPVHQELQMLEFCRSGLENAEPRGKSCVILDARSGLLMTALARSVGWVPIIVVGPGGKNLDALGRMGADVTIDESKEDYQKHILAELDGGADLVIDMNGDGHVRPEVANLLKTKGRLCSIIKPTQRGSLAPAADEDQFQAVLKLLTYERINPRPAYALAVPLAQVERTLKAWEEDSRLLKSFMSTALREDFRFEHYRSPIDATLYKR